MLVTVDAPSSGKPIEELVQKLEAGSSVAAWLLRVLDETIGVPEPSRIGLPTGCTRPGGARDLAQHHHFDGRASNSSTAC